MVVLLVLVFSVLFLVVVIILSTRFWMSSSRCIDESTLSSILAIPFLLLFLAYNLSTSSLGCNVLRMVISFRALWSICLSFSLVHFMNGPEYLTRRAAKVFIHLITFLLDSFVSSSFLVLQGYYLLIFFFFIIISLLEIIKFIELLEII